jgi:Leucine-rich repeat (LRR) protein
MSRTITWLHLSDLHACKPRTGWDASRVTKTLRDDLQKMNQQHGLHPDLIFFTGDAAFGHLGADGGKSIHEQFREAHDFLTAVREAFSPVVEQRNLFLVPGNHDVNRAKISKFEIGFLENAQLAEIEKIIQTAGVDWKRLIGRLEDYANFLECFDYDHLLTQRDRLIYADAREVAGVRIGIAGFNSAWSAYGGKEELGKLWMAGRFQLETLRETMPAHDMKIALLHHPCNWLGSEENPSFRRLLGREFTFVLHGHEHQDFVETDASTGHSVISAGACHEWSESKNNGYNFIRLNLDTGAGEVWLRQYESIGGGWVPRCITGKTDERGCWKLPSAVLALWMGNLNHDQKKKSDPPPLTVFEPAVQPNPGASEGSLDPAADYEARYRRAIASKLDYLQLFGIEVPRESKEYSLTVGYVSLNLADEDEEASSAAEESSTLGQPTTISADYFFDLLRQNDGRLLIRGPAGGGKTTLLRWAAVQAGKKGTDIPQRPDHFGAKAKPKVLERGLKPGLEVESEAERQSDDLGVDWREKVPFLIRLRDYPKGELPRPQKFPLLLAKELPDPPQNWVDQLLRQGRGLLMFDGIDEVPPIARDKLLEEIRALIVAYPDCYYVATTRPEAIQPVEFKELHFTSARVEPMSPADRDTFIDRWHAAMEVRLQNWQQPQDLRPLAQRLKQRLQENRAIERLTTNPLLCAAVCAIHRQRNENLPETPVELCERLCEMLLYRRDRERPGLENNKNFDESYNRLTSAMRKGLVSKLAYEMVVSGLSSIPIEVANQHIAAELNSYALEDLETTMIRQALVERSGMLQESGEQRIEFLHNTLKEFLASERFVNMGSVDILAANANNPAWQPVILFALALPRDGSGFTTNLLSKLLVRIPAESDTRMPRAKQQVRRISQFFFLRCFKSAYQCDDLRIKQAFQSISEQLFPLQNLTDAEALATCGDVVIPYLKNHYSLKAIQRAANIRALFLIGSSAAEVALQTYFNETSQAVTKEFIKGFLINETFQLAENQNIASLTNLTFLYLSDTHISDVTVLASLTNLTSLYLSDTHISDVTPLASLTNLTFLYLSNTQISDVTPLASLTNLTSLYLSDTQISDVTPLASLTNLTSLNLRNTQISDVTPLASLTNLTSLDLSNTQISDVTPLASLTNLTSLDLSNTQIIDVTVLASLTNLTSLNLRNTQISDVTPLASLTNLTSLYLSNTQISDVTLLASLTNLTSLDLSDTQISDVTVLASLTNLTSLDLSNTQISDVTVLASLTNLTSLNLRNTQISDVTPLASLTNLTSLNLRNTQISDVTPLASLTNLTSLNLRNTQISDVTPLASLTNLTSLNLDSRLYW